jgi:hypothetical protein
MLVAVAVVLVLIALVTLGIRYSLRMSKEVERANWRNQRKLEPVLGTDKRNVKILFIGNSLTDVNNLPRIVQVLGQSDRFGHTVEVAEKQAGGFTLQQQWQDLATLQAIQREPWDFVVLQGQGEEAFANPTNMMTYAQKLDQVIAQNHSVTMLYLTFPRQYELNFQTAINRTYFDIARKIGAEVAVVGPAWANAMQQLPQLQLYQRDQIHPTPAGSYLAGCVFYATIFGRDPTGLPGTITGTNGTFLISLDPATAQALQRIAWKTVQDLQSKWMTPSTRTSQARPLSEQLMLQGAAAVLPGNDFLAVGSVAVGSKNFRR